MPSSTYYKVPPSRDAQGGRNASVQRWTLANLLTIVVIGFLLIPLIAILTVMSVTRIGYAAYKVFALSKDL